MDGRLDNRGQPVLDLGLAGARDTLTALIDTGFDGELLGCQLLRDSTLDVNFPTGTVRIIR